MQTALTLAFTAAQAAQKWLYQQPGGPPVFTAAQAAQNCHDRVGNALATFTAAQAAQKTGRR